MGGTDVGSLSSVHHDWQHGRSQPQWGLRAQVSLEPDFCPSRVRVRVSHGGDVRGGGEWGGIERLGVALR